jgi:hypothetical protein
MAVRLRHFQKGIHFSDSGNVIRNEGLYFSIEFDLLGLVPVDVFKKLLYLSRYREVSV